MRKQYSEWSTSVLHHTAESPELIFPSIFSQDRRNYLSFFVLRENKIKKKCWGNYGLTYRCSTTLNTWGKYERELTAVWISPWRHSTEIKWTHRTHYVANNITSITHSFICVTFVTLLSPSVPSALWVIHMVCQIQDHHWNFYYLQCFIE